MSERAVHAANDIPRTERHTRQFLEKINGSGAPPMETLSIAQARAALVDVQSSVNVNLSPVDTQNKTITIDGSTIDLIIVRPKDDSRSLPVFMFFHGGGWVLGDFPTHERLITDLVVQSQSIAVYVDYTRSPEAQYPTAINQAFAATRWVADHSNEINADSSRLAVVGNSVGGNMATVVALLAAAMGPVIRFQVLLWPVTDACFDTGSYNEFENNHFLTRNMMKWFWDNYTKDPAKRKEIYASPLRAPLDVLNLLPPALVVTAELDVLRDEGEAYARKLNEAGVDVISVRVNGMIHDFGLLNPLADIPAVQAAIRQAALEIMRSLS